MHVQVFFLFGTNRTTSTAKKWDSRGDIFAMAKIGRVSGFWRFLGKYLGTEEKLPYWEPTGENPRISGPEDIRTLRNVVTDVEIRQEFDVTDVGFDRISTRF